MFQCSPVTMLGVGAHALGMGMHLEHFLPAPPVPPCRVLFVCSDPENRAGSPQGHRAASRWYLGCFASLSPARRALHVTGASPAGLFELAGAGDTGPVPAPPLPRACLWSIPYPYSPAAGIPVAAHLRLLCCPTGLVALGFCCSALGFVVTRQRCGHGVAPAALRCLVPRG